MKQRKRVELGSGFYSKTESIFSNDDIQAFIGDHGSFYREYAEINWLEPYFTMKATSTKIAEPSLVATISDMPSSRNNQFISETETLVFKKIKAKEWLDHFHEMLDMLPEDFVELIKTKYLKRGSDGRTTDDVLVYESLNLSRSTYYRRKHQALEELGRALYRSFDFD